jgi:tRNA U34 5-methylaminomethyl-2-thiouridine-forming methyltransferase MnmC
MLSVIVNQVLWSTAIFKKMYALKNNGVLVTYAAGVVVKRNV